MVDIGQLNLDLLKRVSVAPMNGSATSQGADPGTDWSLVTIDKARGKLQMRLNPVTRDLRGAWELTTAPGAGRTLPVLFLPWMSKRVVKLEIGTDCPHFATAAINGCSVFTKGPQTGPTIFHGGITGVKLSGAGYHGTDANVNKAATAGNSAEFWKLLLTVILEPKVWEDKGWSEVNNTMYVNDGSGTTKRAKAAADAVIKNHKKDPIDWYEHAKGNPWGSYLGFLNGGKWSMYLQENLTFFYTNKTTKKQYASSFPIALTQIYPRGQEKTNLVNPVPDRIANPFTASDTVVEGWV